MWSKKYDKCIECGKTDRRYRSKGLCERCDHRRLYREDPDHKNKRNEATMKWYWKNREVRLIKMRKNAEDRKNATNK